MRLASSDVRFATIVLSLVALALGLVLLDARLAEVSEKIKPAPAEEQRRLERQMDADEAVESVLAAVAGDNGADRVVVSLAHNGQTDVSGRVSFMWLTATHLHLRRGLAWDEKWSRPRLLTGFTATVRRMLRDGRPRCVRRDRGDADLTEVDRAAMLDRGVEASALCPLVMPGGEFIGTISAEYTRREAMPKGDALTDGLTEAGEKVRAILTRK